MYTETDPELSPKHKGLLLDILEISGVTRAITLITPTIPPAACG